MIAWPVARRLTVSETDLLRSTAINIILYNSLEISCQEKCYVQFVFLSFFFSLYVEGSLCFSLVIK